jgi:hypothetical protein
MELVMKGTKIRGMCKETVGNHAVPRGLSGTLRGVLAGLTPQGEPLVDFCGNPSGQQLMAVTVVPVQAEDVGREIVLLFEDGDPNRPLLVGFVQTTVPRDIAQKEVGILVDGRRLTVAAEHEIVLECGEASITLTRAGKILIKGTYVLSRSTGVNRIKGGSVQLN